jgi:hypothetical protein
MVPDVKPGQASSRLSLGVGGFIVVPFKSRYRYNLLAAERSQSLFLTYRVFFIDPPFKNP